MKKWISIILAIIISVSSITTADARALANTGENSSLMDIANMFGWDVNAMESDQWKGLDGKTYKRSRENDDLFYQDHMDASFDFAIEIAHIPGISKLSELDGIGTAASIVAAAYAELAAPDNAETPAGSNNCKYNTWYYGHPVAGESYPWCAVFISYIAEECGLIDNGTYCRTAGCAQFLRYFRDTKEYPCFQIEACTEFGGGSYTCVPGDIVIWPGTSHIALIVESKDNGITIIEGNSLSRVLKRDITRFNIGGAKLSGGTVIHVQYPSGPAMIYSFLRSVMHESRAVACGIMANMERESGFNPQSLGDNGTSFGLCQWHLERWTGLKSYCASIGQNPNEIDGQLMYLKYELENSYNHVLKLLHGETANTRYGPKQYPMSDTPEGAYLAGEIFCAWFESPVNAWGNGEYGFGPNSQNRGRIARDTYWPTYAGNS